MLDFEFWGETDEVPTGFWVEDNPFQKHEKNHVQEEEYQENELRDEFAVDRQLVLEVSENVLPTRITLDNIKLKK